MVSEHSNPAASEESLLGTPPSLSEDEWGQMLNSAFEAPPGFADGIVDAFDAPESADDTIDVDDHSIDFDGVSGGAAQTEASEPVDDADDSLIDLDDDAADQEQADPSGNNSSGSSSGTENSASNSGTDDNSGGVDENHDFGFGIDTLSGEHATLTADAFDSDGIFSIDTTELDTTELDSADLGEGLDDGLDTGLSDGFGGDGLDTDEHFA